MEDNVATKSGVDTSYAADESNVNKIVVLGCGKSYIRRIIELTPLADMYFAQGRMYELVESLGAESFNYSSYEQELRKKFEVYCIFLVLVFEAQGQPPKHYDASRCPKFSLISKLGPSERGPPWSSFEFLMFSNVSAK